MRITTTHQVYFKYLLFRLYNLVWSIPKAVPCLIIPSENLDEKNLERFNRLKDNHPIALRYFGYTDI